MDDLSSDGSLPSLDSPQPPEDDVEKSEISLLSLSRSPKALTIQRNLKEQNLAPSECAICGGPANGYHYEAPSCNSCKTFFRRVMLRGRLPMCKKLNGKEECPQRKNGRAVCRGCRFERCISAGMDCRVIESATGAHRSNQLFKLVMKRQGRQIKEEEKQEVEKEDIHEQPSTSNALVHVSTPLSTEADHFKTLVFLKTMDSDLRSRIEGPDGLVPLPSQSLSAYIMGGQYSKKTMAKTIDEAQSFMGSFACTHYLIEYERASQMCSRFPFYEKLGSQDKYFLS
ncbi:unnamed protein product, partial [Mesorhabditis belari]|uniref:Nuclear receptor domain-containing protein n=1 Tax=Mesorhabditis belari TaxID=2138241 RepID=A0AAF3FSU8_9BILA